MDPRGILWNGARERRSAAFWAIPLALMVFWVVVTAFTMWELATVTPTLRRLAACVTCGDQPNVVVWERPNPLLF
jgi:hypothetical protein